MISPEPFIQKCGSRVRAKDHHLGVKDGRIRLAWMDGGAAVFMKLADAIGLGISHDMLLDALSEAGGATSMNGRYPLSDAIRQGLRRLETLRSIVVSLG